MNHQPSETNDTPRRLTELEHELVEERERRYRAENNERCFRELAEHIREVFWMTNAMGDELVYVSPAYENIWGQTCDSLYEDPGSRLTWVHEADREQVLVAFKRDAATGDYDEIFRIDRPDGQMRWIRDRAYPVYDDAGQLYRLAGFALDITDRIQNNDRLTRLNDSISTRDRMAIFAALGTGLAHDLSQPLTAARNFIAHAGQHLAASARPARTALTRADTEIERATSMIHHLRDFVRDGEPARRVIPLAPLIDDIHQIMDAALRENDVRYYGPDPAKLQDVEVPIDRILTQQILRNLITNAIDAFDVDHTSRDIRIDTAQVDDHIEIEVSDNGPGIGEDVALFEPFATTKAEGLGLGLAISRTLARSHGGDLMVANRGRAGAPARAANDEIRTAFVLRLPLA
ncbi:ATP-binding protein [Salinisphaera sp. T31B1]|uniref:sensor histidine kinase n=1 Tax=Salinisphaera sp. T31B1 TaxID=727963 RepID=UPI003341D12D